MDEDRFYADFGRRLADKRRALDLTQAEIAAIAETSRASVANIEAGRQKIYLHQIYRLAQALRLDSLSELIPLDVPKSGERMLIDAPADLTDIQLAQIEGLLRTAIAGASPSARRGK